jgi:hypothetical protein
MKMIEKIRDLVTAGEGVFEIEHIDRHIDRISRKHKRLGFTKDALEILKETGVKNVIFVDFEGGNIKIKSNDMAKVAKLLDVDIQEQGGVITGTALVGDVKIHSILNPGDAYSVKKESGAFIFNPNMRARDLIEFIDCMTKADDSAVEHFFYNGDFQTWLKSIGKIDLAKKFDSRKGKGYLGNELKKELSKTTLNYIKTRVKAGVKEDVKKRLRDSINKL